MPSGDLYLLGRSASFTVMPNAEDRTDLSLQPNVAPPTGRVTGTVSGPSGPISGAVVKLLTAAGAAVDHTLTNSVGHYIFTTVPPGSYQVVATADGYLLPPAIPFTLVDSQTRTINISLTPITSTANNVIFGIVTDTITGLPIEGATVGLVVEATGVAAATSETNSAGQFVLYAIADDTYDISAQATGYITAPLRSITVSGGVIAQSNIELDPSTAPSATVNGFILSDTGIPLAGACVGLYALAGTIETLVQLTFSDSRGFYLFGSVTAGTYLVKAKVEGPVTIPIPPAIAASAAQTA